MATAPQAPAAPGVNGQLATLVRADGSVQVSYNGHPLYYWQGETKPGDVTGQGKAGFTVALASGPPPTSAAPSRATSGYGYHRSRLRLEEAAQVTPDVRATNRKRLVSALIAKAVDDAYLSVEEEALLDAFGNALLTEADYRAAIHG